jgi:hypothetical protein
MDGRLASIGFKSPQIHGIMFSFIATPRSFWQVVKEPLITIGLIALGSLGYALMAVSMMRLFWMLR